MATLAGLEDVDLTTVELEDGTPLLVQWAANDLGGGIWIARGELPASAVAVDIGWTENELVAAPLYDSSTVQDLLRSLLRDGHYVYRQVTDDEPESRVRARLWHFTDYRRNLPWNKIGGHGAVFALSYGWPGSPAGGNVNLSVVLGEVRASEDPANEIGGCIGSLQLGRGGDPPPTASLWGSSYTLRGSVGRRPGGLMAYSAVVQNYFDGSGSRSPNYGYAALTRPGIGDGADFHRHDPIRNATTYPVDYGFIVCGDSGPFPSGGGIGYRVAFQAGGWASPWAGADEWRSRIGVGLVARDWVEAGIHVHPSHPDAPASPHIRLDGGPRQAGNYLECRSQDGTEVSMAVRPDGRVQVVAGSDPADAVTVAQLEAAMESIRQELDARMAGLGGPALASTPTSVLGGELLRRMSPLRAGFWRSLRRRALGIGVRHDEHP